MRVEPLTADANTWTERDHKVNPSAILSVAPAEPKPVAASGASPPHAALCAGHAQRGQFPLGLLALGLDSDDGQGWATA